VLGPWALLRRVLGLRLTVGVIRQLLACRVLWPGSTGTPVEQQHDCCCWIPPSATPGIIGCDLYRDSTQLMLPVSPHIPH